MTQTEALKRALEALEDNQHLVADNERHAYVMEYNDLIEKCKEALAQPVQEPVAIRLSNGVIDVLGTAIVPIGALLYTTPPQRTWVGLTDEEIAPIIQQYHWLPTAFVRAVEAKLKDKNT